MKKLILLALLVVAAMFRLIVGGPKAVERAIDGLDAEDLRYVVDLFFAPLSLVFWVLLIVAAVSEVVHLIAAQGGL